MGALMGGVGTAFGTMAGSTFANTKYGAAMGVVGGLLPMAAPLFGLFGGSGPSNS